MSLEGGEATNMPGVDPRGVFFDSRLVGEPEYNYVCWLDVMGTRNQMERSVPTAATFIFKLHCAVLEAYDELECRAGLRLYPVMDGVYIASRRRGPLQTLLNQALRRVVAEFLAQEKHFHRFIARAAVAFGPVYHGHAIVPETSRVLSSYTATRDSILVGLPVVQAFLAERDAPPFGIAAHSSARAFAPEGDDPFRFIWLNWFRASIPPVDTDALIQELDRYFEWQEEHCNMTGYEIPRIEHHRKLAHEYFTASD
jgi:hypothetical protein